MAPWEQEGPSQRSGLIGGGTPRTRSDHAYFCGLARFPMAAFPLWESASPASVLSQGPACAAPGARLWR